jgi:hypothetical protein
MKRIRTPLLDLGASGAARRARYFYFWRFS